MTPHTQLAATALLIIGLSACSAQATPSHVTTSPGQPSTLASPLDSAHDGESNSPMELVVDEQSAAAAKAAATAGMAAFARPGLRYDQWWAGLEPLLSSNATAAYRTVDPAHIPATQVTGEASLSDWDTPRIARVGVPTDAGSYLVIVSRSEIDPVWRVERITPPEVR